MKRLVYNPGLNPVVYDNGGQMVDPGAWAYVEGDLLDRALNRNELVEIAVPDSIVPDTDSSAVPALEEAIADRAAQQDESENKKDETAPPPEVRNTDAKTKNNNARSRTETEA